MESGAQPGRKGRSAARAGVPPAGDPEAVPEEPRADLADTTRPGAGRGTPQRVAPNPGFTRTSRLGQRDLGRKT